MLAASAPLAVDRLRCVSQSTLFKGIEKSMANTETNGEGASNGVTYKEFLLAALRVASLRAKTMDAELVSVGIALKGDLITPDAAMQWVHDEGLMFLIGPPMASDLMKKIPEGDNARLTD
jgi:hypothetical protein